MMQLCASKARLRSSSSPSTPCKAPTTQMAAFLLGLVIFPVSQARADVLLNFTATHERQLAGINSKLLPPRSDPQNDEHFLPNAMPRSARIQAAEERPDVVRDVIGNALLVGVRPSGSRTA